MQEPNRDALFLLTWNDQEIRKFNTTGFCIIRTAYHMDPQDLESINALLDRDVELREVRSPQLLN